jgi:hypothetical protein
MNSGLVLTRLFQISSGGTQPVTARTCECTSARRCQLALHQYPRGRYRGTSLIRTPPPVDPTEAPCLGTYGDPRGGAFSYERGNPVASKTQETRQHQRPTPAPLSQPARVLHATALGDLGAGRRFAGVYLTQSVFKFVFQK